ncbi:glycosyltransferase family 2 protein [Shewanella sp.]|uniref:glycosyltransferase family 2 protein n=2 Tax=Pseudomonadati TaxID=3379134 RepID=UPI0040475CBF
MIDYSHRFNMIRDSDVVSFPDDDCWYPNGFLDFISKEIKELDFKIVYTKYGSSPTIVSLSLDTNKHAIKNLVSFASSNTTFYNSNLFVKVGFFNEEFGVGAKYNGGEDTDFAIRSLLETSKLETSKQSIKFIDSILVGHRDPNSLFKYKYFNGSLRVLKLHSLKSVGLFYIYFRKLVVGLFFYASGKISLSDLNTK